MTAHTIGDVQMWLLRWIDRGLRFEPDSCRWLLQTRGLERVARRKWREYVVGELWRCADTLTDSYCDRLEIPRGSTYGAAVRKVWFECLGEEGEAAAYRQEDTSSSGTSVLQPLSREAVLK